ncbi:hint-domain-containing protein [Xylariales sp. AK1849]|nr:hint-domain-containing protein [Xylariales sp. AK1849]
MPGKGRFVIVLPHENVTLTHLRTTTIPAEVLELIMVRRLLPEIDNDLLESFEDKLTISPASTASRSVSSDANVSIHPLPSQEGVIIKVEPPRYLDDPKVSHVPCDIVLVIDVSWSMRDFAPAASWNDKSEVVRENAGFSVLDITKHAALTVLETLNDRDRLGIISFSTKAKVVQQLLPMSQSNKSCTAQRIMRMEEEHATNLWGGIVEGLGLFKSNAGFGRVPAILVLTDGQPNHGQVSNGHPLGGYVPAIRAMGDLPAIIHTFGFGNDIRSGLLKSIAEIGGGNYAFIPDAGMVGTVIVNAVAHLQSTFANRCSVEITYPDSLGLAVSRGKTDKQQEKGELNTSGLGVMCPTAGSRRRKLALNLGNLQFGQSRDVYLAYSNPPEISFACEDKPLNIDVQITYTRMYNEQFVVRTQQNVFTATSLPDAEIAYHQSRAMVCEYLSSFFPLKSDGEYDMPPLTAAFKYGVRSEFRNLLARIPAADFPADARNSALLQDLTGQIKMAVFKETYLRTWGTHYFLSLWGAHAKQFRNTFKDPGVQMYNAASPLFLKCQQELINAFNTTVEAPEPSLRAEADEKYSSGAVTPSMSSYYRSDYPCFAGSSLVAMADGKHLPISELRKGMAVRTPAGSRRVVAVLKNRVKSIVLCKVGNLLVTPWHPLMVGTAWTFPAQVANKAARYSGAVYSVLLQPDGNTAAHAIRVCGIWGTALGHGVVKGDDIRAHGFLGDYRKVLSALLVIGVGSDGVAISSGVRRGKRSGRLEGFRKGLTTRVKMMRR